MQELKRIHHEIKRAVSIPLHRFPLAQSQNGAKRSTARPLSPLLSGLARQAAADGCVLLENDGVLPLDPEREVAVFGRTQIDWSFMGHGSGGDVNAPYLISLIDAIEEAGYAHNQMLAELYRSWTSDPKHAAPRGAWGLWPQSLSEMPMSDRMVKATASTSKVALITIGRNAGEDQDLALREGGYYLTQAELELIEHVTSVYDETVIVIASSNIIDLSWTERFGDRLSAIVLANQGGMEAGRAVADVLWGKTNPSGRLTATIAKTYEDYPSAKTFGKRRVEYTEGIFVGYRYFDSMGFDQVRYPFGHGLSYTTFEAEPFALERDGAKIVSKVLVTNTGERAGAHAVLLWCLPPATDLEKPRRVLVAFNKTKVLEGGATEELALSFTTRDLASFDDASRAWLLEAGTFHLMLDDVPAGSIDIADNLVVRRVEHFCKNSDELRMRILERMPTEIVPTQDKGITFDEAMEGTATLQSFVAQLSDKELVSLTQGEGAMGSPLGPEGNAGAFGGVSETLRHRGVPAAICSDGPSGLRLAADQSLIPSATTLASTFDDKLVESLYFLVGLEALEADIDILLAPGMNIQRDPRCGRNFEYFSEDPLVSGKMAAAVVRGLRTAGISACPKHLCANNQERRRNISDSRVSERALREIYLRGFEICVTEAHPDLVMTSYNLVNGTYAHYHFDLATTILRREWGFAGVVITDWWMRRAHSPEFAGLRDNGYRIRAGVDVLMPGSMSRIPGTKPEDKTALLASRAELQQSAARVLRFLIGVALRKSTRGHTQ